MKKIFILLFFIPNLVVAKEWFEAHKQLDCGPFSDILSIITEKGVNEEVSWIGESEGNQSQVALFLNPKTSTWTLVQYNKDYACVLEMGKNYKTYKPKSKNTKN